MKYLFYAFVLCIVCGGYIAFAENKYVLSVGEQGAKALELQQKILSNVTKKLVIDAGLKRGDVVWDVGCGTGAMVQTLSQIVGPKGHVYAIDKSQESLDLAKKRSDELGLKNVTFVQGDLTTMILPSVTPNFIHSRFVFMHIQTPEVALKRLYNALKPGGSMAFGESSWKELSFSSPIPGFEELKQAIMKVGQNNGSDYSFGSKLTPILKQIGLQEIKRFTEIPNHSAIEMQALMVQRLKDFAPHFLNYSIADNAQIEAWSKMVGNMHTHKDAYVSANYLYFVSATKPLADVPSKIKKAD